MAITTTVDIAGLDGRPIRLSSDQLDDLHARTRGPLLYPRDEGWDDAVRIWNGMVTKAPALAIQPASTADVAAIVRFARDHRLLISVKGGGHNIGGTAISENGLLLDLSQMNDVSVDAARKLAQVGPGCRLKDVDRATQQHGLATVLGFISEVGVGGLTLGGGLGYLTRRFGWTVDNLQEAQVVTADGMTRTASLTENGDLFWALRGGGGNFGVVTRFTFRLHDVGPAVYGGLIAWPFDRARECVDAYRAITAESPPELATWLIFLNAPPAPFVPAAWHHKPLCAMCVCYTGDLRKTNEVLARIHALGSPAVDLLREQPYTELQSYLDVSEPKGLHYYWKTGYLATLDDQLLSTLTTLFAECAIPGVEIGALQLEGALNQRAVDDGAVGNRDARFIVGVNGMWDPDERRADEFRQWIREAWQRVAPFTTGSNYINFQTADEDESRIRATYGANFPRLVAIKEKYDPENLFRVNRNIRPN
jgi:FAD/FMN-containing dehydrogenase